MGMRVMPMRKMRVMSGFFMIASLVVLGCLMMVLCGMFVVFRRLAMMVCCLF